MAEEMNMEGASMDPLAAMPADASAGSTSNGCVRWNVGELIYLMFQQ